jgi:hypothetical protein
MDSKPGPQASSDEYEAPRLERVVSPDDIEREVHYAGPGGSPDNVSG